MKLQSTIEAVPRAVPARMTEPPVTFPVERILFVEDDPAVRRLCAMILRKSGYQVDEAADGEAGWETLQFGAYDVLVTDYEMPRLSGLELAERVRGAGYLLPVILCSGAIVDLPAWRGLTRQITSVLRKPFTADALRSSVGEALRPIRGVVSPVRGSDPRLAGRPADKQEFRQHGINE